MKKLILVAVALITSAAFGYNHGIAYHGRLRAVNAPEFDGLLPIPMTFRIYDAAENGTVLWARRTPVVVDKDGSFSLVLADENGVAVDGAKYRNLEDACAGEDRWIGLTPDDDRSAREFKPRQKIATAVASMRAAVTESADSARAPSVNFMGTVIVDRLNAGTVKVASPVSDGTILGNSPVSFDGNITRAAFKHVGSGVFIMKNYYPGCTLITSAQSFQSSQETLLLSTLGTPLATPGDFRSNYCTEFTHCGETADTTDAPGHLAWIIGG